MQLLASASDSDIQQPEASTLSFLHTFNTCHLLNRLFDDAKPQQLNLVKTFASSKSCTPHHLLQLGILASHGNRTNPEAAEFALNSCLSKLLASPSPDYQTIATILRKLIILDTKSDGSFSAYREAYQIIVGLKEGEYPTDEGKWLATTAWNKGGMAIRLRQVEVAKKWMQMGLDLARHVKGMEKYVEGMEESFANFEKICDGGGCGSEVDDHRGSSSSRPEIISQ